ncbi:hypothetical protein [Streptomyces sp. NPDC094472]|uniref:hypothetical protein n=1 Tax=Streptomyces sp. NPDC094472 TaxID=3155080 RepID=UPI00331E5663
MIDLSHPTPTTGGIFSRLDAEWTALSADPSVQTVVTNWLIADQLAADVASVTDSVWWQLGPEQVLATLRPQEGALAGPLADAVLRALLQRAAGDDRSATLAARIVVQAMLPAAVRMARGQVRSYGGRSFDAIGHMVIAALFETARSGRIHHRPGRPAANLALDTLGRVCRELAAEREDRAQDLAVAELLADPAPGPAARAYHQRVRATATAADLEPTPGGTEVSAARLELLELVLAAMEAGCLSTADGQSIAWHYCAAPLSDTAAAARVGTTATAWQRRRSRAVARLKSTVRRAA